MPLSENTSNFERADWGRAGIDAMFSQLSADEILLAYSEEKTGHGRLYDERNCVVNDLLCDALHTLIEDQFPGAMEHTLVQMEDLDLNIHEALLTILVPESERIEARDGAYLCNLEEQDEAISAETEELIG